MTRQYPESMSEEEVKELETKSYDELTEND